jgi:drug/metabolite transporter (DMT)-like permease
MIARLRQALLSPILLLALTQLFWAGNWVVGRAVREEVPPIALTFWRWVIALALIAPLAWPHLRRQWPEVRAGRRSLLLLGLLGTGFYNALAYTGLQQTSAINGVLLNAFIPLLIVVIAWAGFGRHVRRVEAAGVAVSLLGVLAIIGRGDPRTLAGLEFNAGDLWILASVLAWALYTNLLPRRPAALHPHAFLACIAAVGLVAMLPFYAWELAAGRRIVPGPTAWAAIAYTGVFPAFLGYLFWNRGVARVGPARAAQFLYLMPAFGVLLSMLFLDERPALYHFAGIALIFGGIYLTSTARPGPA